ncbi:STM3941 family protein [Oceanobacillus timonensis]|uniref:STM3941 family protein n=1 Tax=Oceanobacillus timonensis TaxID=1926285 RepID=UPI0009B93D06|nr:STM3941 family protein [Oceanobacillus timonensis]
MNSQEMYFKSPKGKSFVSFIFSLAFFTLGIALCTYFFKEGNTVDGFIFAVFPLIFGVSTLLMFKMLVTSDPYITLTKEELIVKHPLKRAMRLRWTYIRRYDIRKVNLISSIVIYLDDNEEYKALRKRSFANRRIRDRLSTNAIAQTLQTNFLLGLVKRKERTELLKELDIRAFGAETDVFALEKEQNRQILGEKAAEMVSPKSLSDQRKEEALQLEQYSQINKKYILKIVGISFFITIVFSFLMYQAEGDNFYSESMPVMVIGFILYPIARMIYDIAGGFKLSFKLKGSAAPHLDKLEFFIHIFLLYILSFIVIPLGAVYLIVRAAFRGFRNEE